MKPDKTRSPSGKSTRQTKRASSRPSKKASPTSRSSTNRPKTKKALLDAIGSERERLEQTFSALSEAQMIQPGVVGEWSIKDILAHLAAWERRLVQRVHGEPERGVDLGTPAFNAQVYSENKSRSLADVQSESQRSYAAVLALAEGLSNADVRHWWRAFALNTYGHYGWARLNIRRWLRQPQRA
jgi:hypothetical protein